MGCYLDGACEVAVLRLEAGGRRRAEGEAARQPRAGVDLDVGLLQHGADVVEEAAKCQEGSFRIRNSP